MYAPTQGSMPQRHPVGGIISEGLRYVRDLITDKDIDRRVIETHQAYLSSHFLGFDGHVLFPAKSYHPHEVHKYWYNKDGIVYRVNTSDLPSKKQLVDSIWDITHKVQLPDLEILVNKHNHTQKHSHIHQKRKRNSTRLTQYLILRGYAQKLVE